MISRRCFAAALGLGLHASAQVIQFEQNGLRYQTLTRGGITVMFARMPEHLRGYSMIQVAVSNGSSLPATVRPEDFSFVRETGSVSAVTGTSIVKMLMNRGDHNDVVKLTVAYEHALYGANTMKMKSTNGYETRRRNAMSEGISARLGAAAIASAVVFVTTKLKPGESTDGAVFFPMEGKAIGAGHVTFRLGGDVYTFNDE